MLKLILSNFIIILFISCHSQDCPENIHTLPMYGKAVKCPKQLNVDIEFLREIDKNYKSRSTAAKEHSAKAWEYFYANEYDMAMKRFNQVWLIDSTYHESYWGFGNIIATKGNPSEAITYYELAKKYNPTSANFYLSLASAKGQLYQSNRNKRLLDEIISELNTGLTLDENNGKIQEMLAITYYYKNDLLEAKKYLNNAENIKDFIVNPEFKALLESKK